MLITTKLVTSSLLWRLRADKCQSFSNRGLNWEQYRIFRSSALKTGPVGHEIFLRFLERAFRKVVLEGSQQKTALHVICSSRLPVIPGQTVAARLTNIIYHGPLQ
jgi:hypothetical protein